MFGLVGQEDRGAAGTRWSAAVEEIVLAVLQRPLQAAGQWWRSARCALIAAQGERMLVGGIVSGRVLGRVSPSLSSDGPSSSTSDGGAEPVRGGGRGPGSGPGRRCGTTATLSPSISGTGGLVGLRVLEPGRRILAKELVDLGDHRSVGRVGVGPPGRTGPSAVGHRRRPSTPRARPGSRGDPRPCRPAVSYSSASQLRPRAPPGWRPRRSVPILPTGRLHGRTDLKSSPAMASTDRAVEDGLGQTLPPRCATVRSGPAVPCGAWTGRQDPGPEGLGLVHHPPALLAGLVQERIGLVPGRGHGGVGLLGVQPRSAPSGGPPQPPAAPRSTRPVVLDLVTPAS